MIIGRFLHSIGVSTVAIDAVRAVNSLQLFRITATFVNIYLIFFCVTCRFLVLFLCSFPAIKSVETEQVAASRLFQAVAFGWL